MAKRGIERQLFLPFAGVRIEEVFSSFKPEVDKCHKLQDEPRSTSGNDFYWWQSRYGEWIQAARALWTGDEYYETGKLFPSVWQKYEQSMRRSKALGVPRAALED